GFARDLRSWTLEHLWLLAVIFTWLLLFIGKPMEGGDRVALVFPAVIVAMQMGLPVLRLSALARPHAQGLHELALLPGLHVPGQSAADTLSRVLLRRQSMAFLATVGAMSAYGWLAGAAARYCGALG